MNRKASRLRGHVKSDGMNQEGTGRHSIAFGSIGFRSHCSGASLSVLQRLLADCFFYSFEIPPKQITTQRNATFLYQALSPPRQSPMLHVHRCQICVPSMRTPKNRFNPSYLMQNPHMPRSCPILLPLQPRNAVRTSLDPHANPGIEHKAFPGLNVVQVLLALCHLLASELVGLLGRGWPALRVTRLFPCYRRHLVVCARQGVVVSRGAFEQRP